MRRGGTLLVVVALAAIGLTAAADALRDVLLSEPAARARPSGPATTAPTTRVEPASGERFGGILYYTDESCELRAVRLPEVEPAEAPTWELCRFVLSPDATRVSARGSGWDPRSDPRIGRLFESAGDTIRIATDRGPEGDPLPGTAAAWRPDGTLTYFADGAVRERPSGEVLLAQRDLVRAAREVSADVVEVRVREAAWLAGDRLATLLSAWDSTGVIDVFALFAGKRAVTAFSREAGRLSDLAASRGGGFVTMLDAEAGPLVLDRHGGDLPIPAASAVGRAIALSPDERWAAVAAGDAVYVVRLGASRWTARLDLAARDLAWRGGVAAQPPESEDAAAWLARAEAGGRLFLTQPTEAGCRLRAVELPALDWSWSPISSPLAGSRSMPTRGRWPTARAEARTGGSWLSAAPEPSISGTRGASASARSRGTCSPAWRPDGTLIFLRDGALVGFRTFAEGERRLVSRRDVRRMLGADSSLAEVAWVDDGRFWGAVRRGGKAAPVLMTASDVLTSPRFAARELRDLRVGPAGLLAATTGNGVVVLGSGGRRLLTFPGGRAAAWTNGLVVAVARWDEILFVQPVTRDVVSLPLTARDLEWMPAEAPAQKPG